MHVTSVASPSLRSWEASFRCSDWYCLSKVCRQHVYTYLREWTGCFKNKISSSKKKIIWHWHLSKLAYSCSFTVSHTGLDIISQTKCQKYHSESHFKVTPDKFPYLVQEQCIPSLFSNCLCIVVFILTNLGKVNYVDRAFYNLKYSAS